MAPRRPKIHLISNAHLDPVWMWTWPEGAAEAISTFRVAAELCETFPGFVFNHNEMLLYEWVRQYEPALFRRIQKLVKAGKWHIMGGCYLQPDCNMPSGESFVRQILVGKNYFKTHFGVEPTTAINFDPFGHTRGLVQILAKSGYDSYMFGRPGQDTCPLESSDFIWVGYDGSELMASRFAGWYNTPLGKSRQIIEERIPLVAQRPVHCILWGVGNHGGGPSRIDLEQITRMINERGDYDILHSTPEAVFKELNTKRDQLPRRSKDLNPWAVGCYTSQIRIKQKHRELENAYYMTEKMTAIAAAQNLMSYPREVLSQALRTLLMGEFHDILPGSSIQAAEEDSLNQMAHGLYMLSEIKTHAFFALASGQKQAKPGDIPILVYNPHPYPVQTLIECEFQLADQNHDLTFTNFKVRQGTAYIPAQIEKEASNIPLDWRKRIVFAAELAPGAMNRFDCEPEVLPAKPPAALKAKNGKIRFKTADMDVEINTRTGLVDRYRANGMDLVGKNAFAAVVIRDDEDPWGMRVTQYTKEAGRFKLMSKEQGAWYSGLEGQKLDSVRIIEDGPVRSVVEAVFVYHHSFICQRYKLPKHGTEIELEIRVNWNEKNHLLKLEIPTHWRNGQYWGQTAYGKDPLPGDGREVVAQKWTGATDPQMNKMITCINDGVYGSDFSKHGIRMTLLRSPAYSGHPIGDRAILRQDGFTERIDQGERMYRFWFNGGRAAERVKAVDREALRHNEKPMAMSFFPSGQGTKVKDGVILQGDAVLMTALKQSEKGSDIVLRLFEPTGKPRHVKLKCPMLGKSLSVQMSAFEIKTLKINPRTKRVVEVNLLESPTRKKK